MIFLYPNTLVTGIDRWHVENMITDSNFFWFGHPFEKSKATGFIYTERPFTTNLPGILIVDLENSGHINLHTFDVTRSVFFCEKWIELASQIASFIKNIVYFKNGTAYSVKDNYKILEE